MKSKILIVSSIFLYLFTLIPAFAQEMETSSHSESLVYAKGRVIKILSQTQNKTLMEAMGGKQIVQKVQVKILDGKYKNKVVTVDNQLTSNPAYDIEVKPSDRVILDVEENGKNPQVYIADKERTPALMIIVGLFFLLMLLVGGMKGLSSLISVLISSALIFMILVPGILKGLPILPLTITIAIATTLLTMFIVGGFNLKSVAASTGTILSLAIAGILALIIIKIAPLSGLSDQESIILWTSKPHLNFTGLLASAVIIGALGAIMDIGMSISSTIAEVKASNDSLTPIELMKSGLNVGRDVIGIMSNTLILAYIGSAFPLILLATEAPLIKLLNLNSIASEITAAIVGSIGIVLCVPITAAIAGYLMGNKGSNKITE